MTLLAAGMVAGVAGFADTMIARNGGDPNFRGALPEPFDIADHGMSWAAGAVAAAFHYSQSEQRAYEHEAIARDPAQDPTVRHENVEQFRCRIAGAVAGGIAAAATYVVLGEVGSEALHFMIERAQDASTAAAEGSTGLGHFDLIDILYGVIPAVAITKLSARRANRDISAIEAQIPQPRARARSKTSSPSAKPGQPKANKRYTPPKSHR